MTRTFWFQARIKYLENAMRDEAISASTLQKSDCYTSPHGGFPQCLRRDFARSLRGTWRWAWCLRCTCLKGQQSSQLMMLGDALQRSNHLGLRPALPQMLVPTSGAPASSRDSSFAKLSQPLNPLIPGNKGHEARPRQKLGQRQRRFARTELQHVCAWSC